MAPSRVGFLSFLERGLEEAKEPGSCDGQKHGQRDVSRGQGGPRIAEIALAALVTGDIFDACKAVSIILATFILYDAVLLLDELLTS